MKIVNVMRKCITNFRFRDWDWWWYDFKYGVQNIFAYLPVLWKDRDWDHQFFLVLMNKKLERMERNIRVTDRHMNSQESAKNIRHVRFALGRLIKGDYHENVYRPHYDKWGEPEWRFEQISEEPYASELHIDYPNATDDELKEKQNEEYRRLMNKEEILRKQDLEYVTSMLRKHLRSWWN